MNGSADRTYAAADIIEMLGLERHPEGGWFVETFVDSGTTDGRAHSTAIYYLLEAGQRSHWHRVDAAEVWHWYAGAPLDLSIHDGTHTDQHRLGIALDKGQRPMAVVPAHAWQSAVSTGAWSLVGCTVAPGFRFSGFEMAPPGWSPDAP